MFALAKSMIKADPRFELNVKHILFGFWRQANWSRDCLFVFASTVRAHGRLSGHQFEL